MDGREVAEAQRRWTLAAAAGGSTAERAAQESLTGMCESLRVLAANLAAIGYPTVAGRAQPTSLVAERVRRIEGFVGGAIPPVLSMFWRVVGGLSLVDLEAYRHVDFWKAQGLRSREYCDGVHIDGCTEEWAEFLCDDFTDWAMDEESLPSARRSFVLTLSPDGYHKDRISGGAYGVRLGSDWLARWENFTWSGPRRPRSAPPEPCDLLGYLRTAILECAGFPGLFGIPQFEEIRGRLLRGVPGF